jgi:hypothetical protein
MVAPAPGTAVTEPATLERLTTTDADGRFRLETVRPGRYFITAGFVDTPTYFPGVLRPADARAVVVTAGSILPGIDFALAQSAGVNVTGRVKGIPDNMPAGYIHVALSPVGITRIEQRLDVVVAPDGTFQFQRVGPGTYGVLTNPTIIGPSAINRIEVKDVDVGPIELAIGPMIVGQVTVDDGSPLPTSLTYATAGYPIVSTPSLVSLVAVRPNPISPLSFGGTVRADGAFVVANYQPGEYRITARLPFGYDIKSLTFGDVDLLKTTLKIPNVASATGSVRMVLTKNPQPGTSVGVKVSGHVTSEPPPATAWILMQPSSPGPVSAGAIGETLVRPDGTFEFQRVPPGVYAAQIIPRQATAPQIAIVVEDVDVSNVEIPNIPSPAPRP